MRPLIPILCILAASSLYPGRAASAADIGVVGLFPGKAVLVVDGAAPKTFTVGGIIANDTLLFSVDAESATIETKGRRQTIGIGQHINRNAPVGAASITVHADQRGHFVVNGQINGRALRMLVDTGATMITFSASDANRLGIDYKKGILGTANTANGSVPVYRVKLDSVKIGDIELTQVDGLVQESGLSLALLGMSFLKRTDMRREGEQMTLIKRY